MLIPTVLLTLVRGAPKVGAAHKAVRGACDLREWTRVNQGNP